MINTKNIEDISTNQIGFSSENISNLINIGGPVVIILLVLSLVATAIAISKALHFMSIELSYKKKCTQALQLWKSSKKITAANSIANSQNPICKLLTATIKGVSSSQINIDKVQSEITRIARYELDKLRSYLKVLEIISTLSPLLGLLGTVLGMIEAFQQLQTAGTQVDPSILSGGIWEALLTTAVGLCVAIPTLVAFTWLDKKVDSYQLVMEDYAVRILSSDAHFVMNLPYIEAKSLDKQRDIATNILTNNND